MDKNKNSKKIILQLFKGKKSKKSVGSVATDKNAKWKGRKSKSWLWV